MKIICFDAEFAIQEILELSVWEADGWGEQAKVRQAFHQYFRPERERRWPGSQRVHHISPQMVASKPGFAHWRARIQKTVDEADLLVGFAIENDIEALSRAGIRGLDRKKIVDVRDLHWLVNTRHQGVGLDARKGLGVTATEVGAEFSENLAHGADYDTRVTLDCFRRLMRDFEQSEGVGPEGESATLARYLQRWDEEREAWLRDFARGWVYLQEFKEGHVAKATKAGVPEGKKGVAAWIEVAARWRALDEIDAHLGRRRHPDDSRVYILRPSDWEWFRNYTNEYDGDETTHRKMAELRQSAARFGKQ